VRKKKFKAELLSGHKDHAVQVPFDPAIEWNIEPKPLWRGPRGHAVNATVNGFSFESSIVPRQKKFYLLINAEAKKAARIHEGAVIQITIEPYAE
jgi:hypothetical protein